MSKNPKVSLAMIKQWAISRESPRPRTAGHRKALAVTINGDDFVVDLASAGFISIQYFIQLNPALCHGGPFPHHDWCIYQAINDANCQGFLAAVEADWGIDSISVGLTQSIGAGLTQRQLDALLDSSVQELRKAADHIRSAYTDVVAA